MFDKEILTVPVDPSWLNYDANKASLKEAFMRLEDGREYKIDLPFLLGKAADKNILGGFTEAAKELADRQTWSAGQRACLSDWQGHLTLVRQGNFVTARLSAVWIKINDGGLCTMLAPRREERAGRDHISSCDGLLDTVGLGLYGLWPARAIIQQLEQDC